MPKEILQSVKDCGYRGYRKEYIEKASRWPEPKRSNELRQIRKECMAEFRNDLRVYREVANSLRRYRQAYGVSRPDLVCAEDVHTSISLKHNHLYNNLAHLHYLDSMLSVQPDLFDF